MIRIEWNYSQSGKSGVWKDGDGFKIASWSSYAPDEPSEIYFFDREAEKLIDAIRKVAGLDKGTPRLESQIDNLANVLMNEFGGPTQSESAVEMAIRLLREYRQAWGVPSSQSSAIGKETPNPEAVKEAIDYYDFSESIEALRSDVRAHNERSDRLRDDIELLQDHMRSAASTISSLMRQVDANEERIKALEQESLQQQAHRDSLIELREDALESVNDYLQSLEGRTPRRIHE